MPDFELAKTVGDTGPGGRVVHVSTQSLANDGTYDTGLSSIDVAFAESKGDSNHTATVSSVSGGTVTVELKVADTAAGVTSATDLDIVAIGTR